MVELLVAIAVLGTLVLFLGQVVALTSRAILINKMKLDSAAQARLFFDRLAMDLAARPHRSDLGMAFYKNGSAGSTPGTNDQIQFYSSVDAYSGTRQVAWINYEIATAASTPYQLVRGANGNYWTSASGSQPLVYWMANATASSTSLTPPLASSSNDVVLAGGIFRLEISFVTTTTGALTNAPTMSTSTTPTSYENVSALVVSVAVLDSRNLALLTSTQLAALSGDFQDNAEGDAPLVDWQSQMATTGFASGLPRQAVQNIRLYQRTFDLN
jgi:type II secretory pathway pseudopilin PulG